jgi:hypothetical protein
MNDIPQAIQPPVLIQDLLGELDGIHHAEAKSGMLIDGYFQTQHEEAELGIFINDKWWRLICLRDRSF